MKRPTPIDLAAIAIFVGVLTGAHLITVFGTGLMLGLITRELKG